MVQRDCQDTVSKDWVGNYQKAAYSGILWRKERLLEQIDIECDRVSKGD